MTRQALLLLGTLALASAFHTRALAQNAFSNNIEVRIDDKLVTNQTTVYVTANQCTPSTKFKFKLVGITSTITNLEAWASSSTGTDCFSSAGRQLKDTTATRSCWFLGEELGVTDEVEFEIDAPQLFRASPDAADPSKCATSSGNAYKISFVPLSTSTDSNPAAPPEALADATLRRWATFTLQTKELTAPGSVSGESGESQLEVSWKAASGAQPTSEYQVFFDTSVGTDSTCADAALVKDQPPPDDPNVFSSGYDRSLKATLKSLDAKGVEIGDYVAAAVVHRDIAGNESPLSEVVCIERVQTFGFLDNCKADKDCKDGFTSCSASRPRKTRGLAFLGVLLGLGVALFVRRGRHV